VLGVEATWFRRLALILMLTTAVLLVARGCASKPAADSGVERPKIYAFWPEAPDPPQVQFVRAFNSSNDVTPESSGIQNLLYGKDRTVVAIQKPYGVRMWNGRIYVCEIRGAGDTGMLVLDLRKREARLMGATGSTTIKKAVDVAIAPDGTKYVLDAVQSGVLVFDAEEHFLMEFGLKDVVPGGCAVHGQYLYVTDQKAGHVLMLDRTSGRELRRFGERGGEDGQFVRPLAVAVDNSGNVYVSDTFRDRVSKFTGEGKFLMAFGEPGDRPGNFSRPKQLGVASNGEIHVVDANFDNVQVFDEKGQVLGYYGASGKHLGAMDMPAGLDVHEGDVDLFEPLIHPAFEVERLVLVTNQFGPIKVAVYAMGHLKEGKTVADIAPSRAKLNSGLATQPSTRPLGTLPSRTAPTTRQSGPAPQAAPAIARPTTAPAAPR